MPQNCLDQDSIAGVLYFNKWYQLLLLLLLLPLNPKHSQLGFMQLLLPPMPRLDQVLNHPVPESSANTDIRNMEACFFTLLTSKFNLA